MKLLSNVFTLFIHLELLLGNIYLSEDTFNTPFGALESLFIYHTIWYYFQYCLWTFWVSWRKFIFLEPPLILINFVIYLEPHPRCLFHWRYFQYFWINLELLLFNIFIPKPGASSSESTYLKLRSIVIGYIWSFSQLTYLLEATLRFCEKYILLKLHVTLFSVHLELSPFNILHWKYFHYYS